MVYLRAVSSERKSYLEIKCSILNWKVSCIFFRFRLTLYLITLISRLIKCYFGERLHTWLLETYILERWNEVEGQASFVEKEFQRGSKSEIIIDSRTFLFLQFILLIILIVSRKIFLSNRYTVLEAWIFYFHLIQPPIRSNRSLLCFN